MNALKLPDGYGLDRSDADVWISKRDMLETVDQMTSVASNLRGLGIAFWQAFGGG